MAESSREPLPADAVTYVARLELGDGTIVEGDACRVRRYELTAELHEPYELVATLYLRREGDDELSLDPFAAADFTMAMHQGVGLDAGEFLREWHGVVLEATYLGTFRGFDHVRVRVGPTVALLAHDRRTRIFQGLSILDVVRAIVEPVLSPRGRELEVRGIEQAEHPPRDYLVQYEESDLAFVQRILADAGLTFAFVQAERERLVVMGSNDAYVGAHVHPIEDDAEPALAYMATRSGPDGARESVVEIHRRRSLRPRTITVQGWDWKSASVAVLSSQAETPADEAWTAGETFHHDVGRLGEGDDGNGPHADPTRRQAAFADARAAIASDRIGGRGNLLGLDAGTTIELSGHTRPELDREYLVTAAVHRGDCPQVDVDEASPFAAPDFESTFEAERLDIPYRPRPRPRPRVPGPQTAVVVGPPGEEIHTDAHGRVRVRMHWDREQRGPLDHTSCWLRVMQAWAGPGWGTLFVPRVGMEVVVAFLGGDPDRPMVVGSVYNGQNVPPYSLPDERTKSTIKTQSSPGGDGSNELRFEDMAGAEEVYLHAQRDLAEVVERAHTTRVGGTQSIRVRRDQSQRVGGTRTVHVGGEEHVTVGTPPPEDDAAPAPPPSLPGTQTTEVFGSIATKAHEAIVVDAIQSLTLRVGSTSIVIEPSGITLAVGGGASVSLEQALQLASAGGAGKLGIDEHGVASVTSSQGGTMRLDDGLEVKSKDATRLELRDRARLEATGGATLDLSENLDVLARRIVQAIDGDDTRIELSAREAIIRSSERAELEGGKSRWTATSSSLDARGPKIDIQAESLLNLLGAITKINE